MIGTADMSRSIATGTLEISNLATSAVQLGATTGDVDAFMGKIKELGDLTKEGGLKELLEAGKDFTKEFYSSMATAASDALAVGEDNLASAADSASSTVESLNSTAQTIEAAVKGTTESLENITVDVRPTEVLLEAFNSVHLGQADAVEKLTGLGEKIEELISQIMATTGETSEPLQVTVQLDGQPIIDRIISNPAGSNNIVISTERVGP